MTNGEKYKTIDQRTDAFFNFCDKSEDCKDCKAFSFGKNCKFVWLELEFEVEEKPLPCPFCGGEAVIWEYDDEGYDAYTVECTKCECRLMCFQPKREDAIEQWNRRVSK